MKFSTPLLLASLAVNVALVAVVLNRTARPPRESSPATPAPRPAHSATDAKTAEALRAALASGDLVAFQAAGIPAETGRELALGRAFARFGERVRAAKSATAADHRWWRNRPANHGTREQEMKTLSELSDLMLASFGHDLGLGGGDDAQLAFLPTDKRTALRQVTQDYDEMIARFGAGGVQLASDREKLQLLRAERERDIAALLTPAELADYEMRTSRTAAALRNRYGDVINSEDDFRKLYSLQKTFDGRYPTVDLSGRITPEQMRARADAQRQLQDDMRAAVGPETYAAMARAADPDWRTLDSLVARLNLPASTTMQVAAARDGFAAESQRINSDAALTPPQRRAQLQELASRAKSSLVGSLGVEAADAYAQRSPWVSMLQNGLAFSTNAKDAPMGGIGPGGGSMGVFPVMPAGGGAMGATRQVFNLSSGEPASTASGPVMFHAVPLHEENTTVISVGTLPPSSVQYQSFATPPAPPLAQPAAPTVPAPGPGR